MNKKFKSCIILSSIFFIGCVAFEKKETITMEGERNRLTSEFYEKAVYLEHQKKPAQAKKNYQLALVADPSNKAARQGVTQMNKQLQTIADKYYRKSIALHKKGKYSEATRYLLIALRLWPEHFKARQELMATRNLNIQKYVLHTIKKGETLSKISKIYYGNFTQSGIIAQANHIKDAGFIRVGMQLKIPELKSYPFVSPKATNKLEQLTDKSYPPEKKTEPLKMYKNMGKDFFRYQEFENAVIEFKKVLNADPTDKESITYISKAYFNLGSNAYAKKKYLTAIENFQQALAFNKKCASCKRKIIQSRNLYKEYHYKAGMKFFDEQNLNSAILEWDLVHQMDTDYKKVAQLLHKAKTIQKNIETIKQSE